MDDWLKTLQNTVGNVGNTIAQGANALGKTIGNQQLFNSPLPTMTINQASQKVNPTSPLSLFTSGQSQKIPGQVASDLNETYGAPRKGETKEAMVQRSLPAVMGSIGGIGKKPPMITDFKADPKAIANYNALFDVPRRIAQNMQVRPDTVINQLIDDGITGVRSIDELDKHAKNITGMTGAFPEINNHILKKINAPVDYTDALNYLKTDLPALMKGETPGLIHEINNEVSKAMSPLNYNRPGQLPSTLPGNQAYASDLFQTSQNLRNIGRMYLRKANTDMGELAHPALERAGRAIMEIKNNIDDAINSAVPPETYQAFKNDPFVRDQLKRVPPKVAQRWLQGAGTFKDGQTIQAPYVNLSHMIEDTKDTQMSVWTKAAKAMQQQNRSGNIGQMVGDNIPGPKMIKNAIGGATQKVASVFDKNPEDINAELTSGKNGTNKSNGKALKTLIGGLGVIGGSVGVGLGAEKLKGNSDAYSENGTNDSNNNHSSSISQPVVNVNSIPTAMTDIKPDPKTGQYSVADPTSTTGEDAHSLAMTDGQYQTAKAQLDALVKSDPSYITNPIKAGQLKAAIDAIDTKHTASQKLINSYQKTSTAMQKVHDSLDLLKKTSPIYSDKIGALEGLHQMADPNYQALIDNFNFIENSDPRLKGQLSNLAQGASAKHALDNVAKLLLSEHNQLLKSYGATGQSAASPTAPVSQLPQGLPAPVNGRLPAMQQQGGWQQMGAPDPSMQLDPLPSY